MKFQTLALAAFASIASAADNAVASSAALEASALLASINSAASSAALDNLAYYSSYYADLTKDYLQYSTGYFGAINSFYQRTDVASAILAIDTMSDVGALETYLMSFNSKYWTELSSIYSVYGVALATGTIDDFSTPSASPSMSITHTGSSATSMASGSSSHSGSHSGSATTSGSTSGSAATSGTSTAASSSSRANADQKKPLMVLTGLVGALSVLIL